MHFQDCISTQRRERYMYTMELDCILQDGFFDNECTFDVELGSFDTCCKCNALTLLGCNCLTPERENDKTEARTPHKEIPLIAKRIKKKTQQSSKKIKKHKKFDLATLTCPLSIYCDEDAQSNVTWDWWDNEIDRAFRRLGVSASSILYVAKKIRDFNNVVKYEQGVARKTTFQNKDGTYSWVKDGMLTCVRFVNRTEQLSEDDYRTIAQHLCMFHDERIRLYEVLLKGKRRMQLAATNSKQEALCRDIDVQFMFYWY